MKNNEFVKKFHLSVLMAALTALSSAWAGPRPRVIYGDDDRIDLYQTQNAKLLQLADSTVALFESNKVTIEGGNALLRTTSYKNAYNLCDSEPFADQRNGAICSGSLVGPDLLMTAGHCVSSQFSCQNTKFVFGFSIKEKDGKSPASVPAAEVYGCKKFLGGQMVGHGADWALVQLERPVNGHAPLAINRTGKIEEKTLLFVIGHPAGLPAKIAGGASVRNPNPDGYFVANLDTYGGNSGSAVFNAKSGLVEGILVRGEQDYVWRGNDGCRVSNRCPDSGCRGEDVTKISALASHIPPVNPPELLAQAPRQILSPRLQVLRLPHAIPVFSPERGFVRNSSLFDNGSDAAIPLSVRP